MILLLSIPPVQKSWSLCDKYAENTVIKVHGSICPDRDKSFSCDLTMMITANMLIQSTVTYNNVDAFDQSRINTFVRYIPS